MRVRTVRKYGSGDPAFGRFTELPVCPQLRISRPDWDVRKRSISLAAPPQFCLAFGRGVLLGPGCRGVFARPCARDAPFAAHTHAAAYVRMYGFFE